MRIGAYQFAGSCDIERNFEKMRGAIIRAAEQGVRLLAFPECALTGYLMDETAKAQDIDFALAEDCMEKLRALSAQYSMYLAAGSATKRADGIFNSLLMLSPGGEALPPYDKRALWGWDLDNFTEGANSGGVYEIDGLRIGLRLCFEVRFPEYFRELYQAGADLCVVSFCDVTDEDSPERYALIKAHLRTRAVENVMTLLSVNDIYPFQAVPTAVFDIDGNVVSELERNKEGLLVYDFTVPEKQFGARGRAFVSDRLVRNRS